MNVPNLINVENLLNSLEKEIDVPSRIKRYKITTPELIEFAKEKGIENEEDAIYALLVADFIATASEVPMGSTDESRRTSVINAFKLGLKHRTSNPDALMKAFYLAYKLAVHMRRQLLFMTSRGLELQTSLLRIHDSYVIPYLYLTNEILGEGRINYDLGILSAAVNRQYPDEELRLYDDAPPFSDFKKGVPHRWQLLKRFGEIQNPEINPTKTIPNIYETQCILFPDSKEPKQSSSWNLTKPLDPNGLKSNISPMIRFLNQKDQQQPLYYLRGHVAGSDERIIMVRDPTHPNKPFFLLRTPANEINLTQILPILELRGNEANGWLKVEDTSMPQPILHEESIPMNQPAPTTTKPQKQGFLAKIMSFFKGKSKQQDTKPIKTRTRKRPLSSKNNQSPNFLAHGIAVDSVGGIPLFEMFDTLRESEYVIVGILESDFNEQKTQIFTETTYLPPQTILDILNGLDEVIETALAFLFEKDMQIVLEEVLFIDENGIRHYMSLAGNNERLVGTLAKTFEKNITDWKQPKQPEIFQRRTLQMRTTQLLSSRQYTPLDTAIERIYHENFNIENSTSTTIDNAILQY